MKPYEQIKAERQAAIKSNAPLLPKGRCHFCDYELLVKGALWCSGTCATDYSDERDELLNGMSKTEQQP